MSYVPGASQIQKWERRHPHDMYERLLSLLLYASYTWYEVRRCVLACIGHEHVAVVRPSAVHQPHARTLSLLAQRQELAIRLALCCCCLCAELYTDLVTAHTHPYAYLVHGEANQQRTCTQKHRLLLRVSQRREITAWLLLYHSEY